MMDRPLRIADIITLAEQIHPSEEIISKTLQGTLHTTNYAEIALRSRQMSKALISLGVKTVSYTHLTLPTTTIV